MTRTPMVVFALLLLGLSGCAISNDYEVYRGQVVDKETREPIVGAAVLAVYYTQSYTLAGSNLEYLDAQETVTDENGEFEIPALDVVTFRFLESFSDYPRFTIFKPGYGCYPKHKGVGPFFRPSGTFPKNQYVVIELPRLESQKERVENVGCFPPMEVPRKKYLGLYNLDRQESEILGLPILPEI